MAHAPYAASLHTRRSNPTGPTYEDRLRMAEASERRALLEGTWQPELQRHTESQLGPLRAKLVGAVDISANLAKSVTDQISTLYDREPEHKGPESMTAALDDWWPMARRHQKNVTLLRESLVRVGWDSRRQRVRYELVTPDRCFIYSAPDSPGVPIIIGHARMRGIPGKSERCWFWDVWDVSNPDDPRFSIWTDDLRHEVTIQHGVYPPEWQGDAYRIRDPRTNEARLPFVLYHAEATGELWDPHAHSEVVFGTLQVGLLWTATVHGFLRASWDQRYLINGRITGGATRSVGGKNVRTITPDPTKIVEIKAGAEGNATAGAWGASIDIEKAEGVVRRYEARLAVHFGLSPADLVIESLNPASGSSIVVSREGKREIQARALPQFRRADSELMEVVAIVSTAWGKPIPLEGSSLRYHGVALSSQERKLVNEYIEPERAGGMLDDIGAYRELHPGTTAEEAEADLHAIAARNARPTLEGDDEASGGNIILAPTDVATVVTVDEARASQNLQQWPDPEEGGLTVAEFKARKESTGAAVGAAEGDVAADEIEPGPPEAPEAEPAD